MTVNDSFQLRSGGRAKFGWLDDRSAAGEDLAQKVIPRPIGQLDAAIGQDSTTLSERIASTNREVDDGNLVGFGGRQARHQVTDIARVHRIELGVQWPDRSHDP